MNNREHIGLTTEILDFRPSCYNQLEYPALCPILTGLLNIWVGEGPVSLFLEKWVIMKGNQKEFCA